MREVDELFERQIDSTLRSHQGVNVRRFEAQWTLTKRGRTARNGKNPTLTLTKEGKWLSVQHRIQSLRAFMPRGKETSKTDWQSRLLRASGKFSGLSKATIDRAGGAEFRADLPLTKDTGIESRVRETLAELLPVALKLKPGRERRTKTETNASSCSDIAALLEQSGWPIREITDSEFIVDLEVHSHYRQARILTRPDGGVTIQAALFNGNAPSRVQRRALSTFLLLNNRHMRLVRFDLIEAKQISVSASVHFPIVADAREVTLALECLSTAVDYCGQSVPLLLDDGVATAYLSAQHWAV